MIKLPISILVLLFPLIGKAQVLIFANHSKEIKKLDRAAKDFIVETLFVGKPALNLDCEVKVREIKQERNFSDGVHIVEMLELQYHTSTRYAPVQKMYLPLNANLTREIKNSRFAGTVEEFQLESDDLVNSRFTFQHDGNGQIIWMSYEDDLQTLPCQLKR